MWSYLCDFEIDPVNLVFGVIKMIVYISFLKYRM
jgi:hypothetical protein